jgi:hypothetical protein
MEQRVRNSMANSPNSDLVNLIKTAKSEFTKFVKEQPKIEGELDDEQISNLLKKNSDKEAELLAAAIEKYITSRVMVELIKLQNDVAKIKRQLSNSTTVS